MLPNDFPERKASAFTDTIVSALRTGLSFLRSHQDSRVAGREMAGSQSSAVTAATSLPLKRPSNVSLPQLNGSSAGRVRLGSRSHVLRATWLPLRRTLNASLPACSDGTAYASLITSHGKQGNSTRLSKISGLGNQVRLQLHLLIVLVHSIRRLEQICHRPFVLLVGRTVQRLLNKSQVDHRFTRELAILAQQQVSYREVEPIKLGVPSMDKLAAWEMTEYKQILVIDVDTMVLRPLDSVFGLPSPRKITMAHHPYDLVQGTRCGIPLHQRGVGAMFAIQPEVETKRLLLRHLATYDAYHLAHYSEQTGLACFFHQSERTLNTLPCSTLYDISCHNHLQSKAGHKSCIKWSGQSVQQCNKIARHISENCYWRTVAKEVRAIHFKGASKPWELSNSCPGIVKGRVKFMSSKEELYYSEDLRWSDEQGLCLCPTCKKTAPEGLVPAVTWASGQAIPRYCCNFKTLLTVEWYLLKKEAYNNEPTERLKSLSTPPGANDTDADGPHLQAASRRNKKGTFLTKQKQQKRVDELELLERKLISRMDMLHAEVVSQRTLLKKLLQVLLL
jgi:lipopolysaccharide biosynthesis glycosyltransferase